MKTNLVIQFDASKDLAGWWVITEPIAIKISQERAIDIIENYNLKPTVDFERIIITFDE